MALCWAIRSGSQLGYKQRTYFTQGIASKKKTLVGKHYFEVPSSNSLLSVLTIEGLFELTRQPLKGPQLALLTHALLPELQRYKDTVRFAPLSE